MSEQQPDQRPLAAPSLPADAPRFVQVALCTSDLPRSVALYQAALGLDDAGGRTFAGPYLARVQRLGADAATVLWWLVDDHELFQLELFAHTDPPQRPLPAGWRPCDLGWVRWAVAVPDLDAALAAFAAGGAPAVAPPADTGGSHRACVRDPHTGIPIELVERPGARGPSVISGAVSVPDLERARAFYVDAVGLAPYTGPALHGPEDEALWGLPGARADGFAVQAGDIVLEVVRYEDPVPQPRPADHRLSDQGFMHMAVGVRDMDALRAMVARVEAHGYAVTDPLPPGDSGGTYVIDGDDLTLEIICVPPGTEGAYGFEPQAPPAFRADG